MASLFVVERTLADAEARSRALDITRSFIVEAPAGSGKTGLMLQRFLKLLATVDQPSQVLAITFTRKATAELRERILVQLQSAANDAPMKNDFVAETRALARAVLSRDREREWNLLEHPHRLNVRTIDSLAMDIASGLPILSGSSGPQSPDPDPEPLYAEAAHRTLMQLGGPDAQLNHAIETILLHRDGNLANCQSLIATMLSQRDQWGELIPVGSDLDDEFLDQHVLPRFERVLDLAICRGLTQLHQRFPADILQKLCVLASELANASGYKGAVSPIANCSGITQTPCPATEDLEHWRSLIHLLITSSNRAGWRKSFNANHIRFEFPKSHRAELSSIVDRLSAQPGLLEQLASVAMLPPEIYPREQWHVAKALFRVLSRALAELQLIFAARATCDFSELSLLARTALRSDSALDDLRASAALDLQHLLVDEMQDTSSGQYELLQMLTQRWDGHGQTVFLVGDPKQSIYKFRQARVERFIHTLHTGKLGHAPDSLTLEPLHLTANFRSQANLVDSFNQDFSLIFPSAADPIQPEAVPYLRVAAVRPAGSPMGTHWHTEILPYLRDTEDMAAQRRRQRRVHAAAIRNVIAEFHSHPVSGNSAGHRTMAILVRNRIHLHEIVIALRKAAIPYRAVEIEPLAERQEILDLIALTRALLHPADRTAWLALLRTPWCGLTLADIHTLAGGDADSFKQHTVLQLMEERGDLLSPDAIARLEPFWTAMTAALEQRGRQPLAQWVHQTWRAFSADRYLDAESLASVHRLLALIDELEDAGTLSLPRLDQRLSRLFATPSVHPGAVDLMTIHGAKGLEWDLVIVPGLERLGMNTNGKLLDWLEADPTGSIDEEEAAPGIVAPIRGKGGEVGKLNEWIRAVDRNREAAERQRLFYVACTRAREELHLFATLERNSSGEARPTRGSLLDAAWPAAQAHFQQLAAAPIAFPQPPQIQDEPGLAIAAAADPAARSIKRIPLPPFTLTPPPSQVPHDQATPASLIGGSIATNPQANLPSRALGITTHALLEQLTGLRGDFPAIESWTPRITTLLRTAGLSPQEVQRQTATVLRALTQTLADPHGRWLLAAHPRATTEQAQSIWNDEDDALANLRTDRTFLAGPQPLSNGDTHLWIVDYKTATHGPEGLDAFLATQQEQYRSQLETYARTLADPGQPIRLALYYPLLQRITWWPVA